MEQAVYAIVLAAGKGTRMKSEMAKVLHPVFFAPMATHVLDVLGELDLQDIVVVTGHQHSQVEKALSSYSVSFARQEKQLGTGHAVLTAQAKIPSDGGIVLIICGDTPLVRAQTLQQMIDCHISKSSTLTVMSTVLDNPANYGRVICDGADQVVKIVEEKDASQEEKLVKEVNAGIYCVNLPFLFSALQQVGTDNAQGEVYLTDIVQIARSSNEKVSKFLCPDPLEITGVNSRVELAVAHKIMQQRRNRQLMLQGVTMLDPETTCVESNVVVEQDVLLHGNCYLAGSTIIGAGVIIEPFVHLNNCRVAAGTLVKSFTSSGSERLNNDMGGDCRG